MTTIHARQIQLTKMRIIMIIIMKPTEKLKLGL